jgi:hypothetical protein
MPTLAAAASTSARSSVPKRGMMRSERPCVSRNRAAARNLVTVEVVGGVCVRRGRGLVGLHAADDRDRPLTPSGQRFASRPQRGSMSPRTARGLTAEYLGRARSGCSGVTDSIMPVTMIIFEIDRRQRRRRCPVKAKVAASQVNVADELAASKFSWRVMRVDGVNRCLLSHEEDLAVTLYPGARGCTRPTEGGLGASTRSRTARPHVEERPGTCPAGCG